MSIDRRILLYGPSGANDEARASVNIPLLARGVLLVRGV